MVKLVPESKTRIFTEYM